MARSPSTTGKSPLIVRPVPWMSGLPPIADEMVTAKSEAMGENRK
jgi:hypothetical protein